MATMKGMQSGKLVTDELADELADETEAGYDLKRATRRRVARPSLGAGNSRVVQLRVPADLHKAARRRARAEGRPFSEIAREALRRYVEGG